MNSSILRYITIFNKNTYINICEFTKFYISWQIEKSDNLECGLRLFEEKKTVSFNDKSTVLKFRKPYNWLIAKWSLENNLTFTISLDACASMLQIISIICQNKKLGELTNIQKNNKNKILDVYSYIKDVIEQNDKSIYVTEYKEILLNRSFIKQCIMTNIYGSTP